MRVSGLAKDSHSAGCAPDLVGWRHKASQEGAEAGRSRVDLYIFLLASICTDPCRLGPLRYRSVLALPFVLPPSRRDAQTPPILQIRPRCDVNEIREYKATNRQFYLSHTRNNETRQSPKLERQESFVFFARPYPTSTDCALQIACVPSRKEVPPPLKKIYTLHIRPSKNTHQVEKVRATSKTCEYTHLQISINFPFTPVPPTSPIRSLHPSAPDHPLSLASEQKAAEKPAHRTQAFSASAFLASPEPENLLNAWSVMRMIVAGLWNVPKKSPRRPSHT